MYTSSKMMSEALILFLYFYYVFLYFHYVHLFGNDEWSCHGPTARRCYCQDRSYRHHQQQFKKEKKTVSKFTKYAVKIAAIATTNSNSQKSAPQYIDYVKTL